MIFLSATLLTSISVIIIRWDRINLSLPSAPSNVANITVEGNTILDTTSSASIDVRDLGPVILLDNTIRSKAGVTSGPVVNVANWEPSDLFSMGNTLTVSSPTFANGHYHSVGDQIVDRSTVNPSIPTLPGTPPNNNRKIFEVAPGSSAV